MTLSDQREKGSQGRIGKLLQYRQNDYINRRSGWLYQTTGVGIVMELRYDLYDIDDGE